MNSGQTSLLTEFGRQCEHILEIGFNAGHSAYTFLSSSSTVKLVSVDIGIHDYVTSAADQIHAKFPQRHQLVIGDSKVKIPDLSRSIDTTFDLIFIDGGHDYETAKAALRNRKLLAHSKTTVLMDDVIVGNRLLAKWNVGPNQA